MVNTMITKSGLIADHIKRNGNLDKSIAKMVNAPTKPYARGPGRWLPQNSCSNNLGTRIHTMQEGVSWEVLPIVLHYLTWLPPSRMACTASSTDNTRLDHI